MKLIGIGEVPTGWGDGLLPVGVDEPPHDHPEYLEWLLIGGVIGTLIGGVVGYCIGKRG